MSDKQTAKNTASKADKRAQNTAMAKAMDAKALAANMPAQPTKQTEKPVEPAKPANVPHTNADKITVEAYNSVRYKPTLAWETVIAESGKGVEPNPRTLEAAIEQLAYCNLLFAELNIYAVAAHSWIRTMQKGMKPEEAEQFIRKSIASAWGEELIEEQKQDCLYWRGKAESAQASYKAKMAELAGKVKAAEQAANERIGKAEKKTASVTKADKATSKGEAVLETAKKSKGKKAEQTAQPMPVIADKQKPAPKKAEQRKPTGKAADLTVGKSAKNDNVQPPITK